MRSLSHAATCHTSSILDGNAPHYPITAERQAGKAYQDGYFKKVLQSTFHPDLFLF